MTINYLPAPGNTRLWLTTRPPHVCVCVRWPAL